MEPQRSTLAVKIGTDGDDKYVLSYVGLRRTVGFLGLALPVAVFAIGSAVPPHEFLGSISAYFYVPFAGSVFVGTLWILGAFLWFYNYETTDNVLTSAAGTFAIGVATFPTTKQDLPRSIFSVASLHFGFAFLFFAVLAILSLFFFTRGDTVGRPRKKIRNRVYVAAGLVIIASLVAAALGRLILGRDLYVQYHVLFFCETLAIWAFGISWLVKGQALFGDLPRT